MKPSLSDRRNDNLLTCPWLPARTDGRTTFAPRAAWKQTCSLKYGSAREAFIEKNRGHYQAIQARRGERGASGSRTARHHRHRSQGLWAAEGSRRTLSRRGIHRGLSTQG